MAVDPRFDLGKTARSMKLLGEVGVTDTHLQRTIDDPIRRAAVAAAYMGDTSLAQVGFDQVLEREVNMTTTYCEIAEKPFPGDGMIEKALRLAEAKCGISINDRFIPGGLGLPELFQFFYGFNKVRKNENRPTLMLAHEIRKEWWRTGKGVQRIPTKPGVFSWDPKDTMRATDLAGRPFNLNDEQQDAWAMEYGGSGHSSVEQITFLFQRHLLETGLPMWGGGSIRGKNAYGSGYSLNASFDADYGFYVYDWSRSEQYWYLGALPEVFLELAP